MKDKELGLNDPKSPKVGLAETDDILCRRERIVPADNLCYRRVRPANIFADAEPKTVSFVVKATRSTLTGRVDAFAANPVDSTDVGTIGTSEAAGSSSQASAQLTWLDVGRLLPASVHPTIAFPVPGLESRFEPQDV